MKQDLLDTIVNGIRNEAIDPSVIDSAAARVRARILNTGTSETNLRQIHGCSDFQALIPKYLNRSLTEAGQLLLEDHISTCVSCRQAMDFARTGKLPVLRRPVVVQRAVPFHYRAAVAAMVVCTVGLGLWSLYRFIVPEQGSGAVVKSVSGALLAISSGSRQIFAGGVIANREHVRTRDSSDAVLRLADGSEVEVGPRSEVWLERSSYETTVHVTRGSIIVHAAKQRHGALHVATADCRLSVKGTIFAVTEGIKGSRVSVVEGAVQLEQGTQTRVLTSGQQATTDSALERTSVPEDVAWSRDSAQYLAILGEFSAMGKALSETPQPGLRYSSKLAQLAPEDTVIYASIPNIGPLLGQASQIFDDRLSRSEVLREWWSEHQPKDGPALDSVIQRVRAFSDYLGSEVSLAVTLHSGNKWSVPLLMAEVTRPGLAEFLRTQADEMTAQGGRGGLQVLTQLPASGEADGTHLYAFVDGNYLFISTSIAQLAAAGEAVKDAAPAGSYRLFPRVQQAYDGGVGWLFAADMEQIRSTSVSSEDNAEGPKKHGINTGIDSLDSVVLERKDVNGQSKSSATLGFDGEREGMAAWVATPAPLGSLEFVSPNASMAISAVIKTDGRFVWDLLHSAGGRDPELAAKIQNFGYGQGASIVNTLSQSLGGDFTIAIDGSLIPQPSWKVAIEVYNSANCQWAIEQFVNGVNGEAGTKTKLHLAQTQSNGTTFYQITADNSPFEVNYAFVNSYLVAAASRSLLTQAIQNQATGYTLSRSENFRQLLPADGNVDFSGLVYYNAGPALGAVADTLKASTAVTPAQKEALAAFAAVGKPGLVYAYAKKDAIVVSSNSGFLGLNLDTLSLPALLASSMHSNLMIPGAKPN